MIVYLDASALVKLYVDEAHTDRMWDLVAAAERLAVSAVTYAESRSAFARRRKEGGISALDHDRIVRDLGADWRKLDRILVDEDLSLAAGDLAERHGLRGFDAIHLASALRVQLAAETQVTMATFDRALAAGAAGEGLALLE